MQVKKFEAKTVKEALEMVKNSLGPDAIILAVRDNLNKYGLVGEGSVEVTAAVSDVTLRKKQFVESKMNDKSKEHFAKAPARMQKEFIDKMVHNHTRPKVVDHGPRKLTARPYIEITDDSYTRARAQAHAQAQAQSHSHARPQSQAQARNVSAMLDDLPPTMMTTSGPDPRVALQRIRSAARDAWSAVQETVETPKPAAATTPATAPAPSPQAQAEILALRAQISDLQKVIEEFRSVPQKMVSAHPGAEVGLPYDVSFMYEKLATAGVSSENIHAILTQAMAEMPPMQLKKKAMVDAWVANFLLNHIQAKAQPFDGRLHVFVGGTGQGKTSMVVKVASHLVIEKHKRVGLVSTDSFKVGAVEQLRIYAQILNVPFVVIRDQSNWPTVMAQLADLDHILVDCPGVQLKDGHESDLIRRLLPPTDLVPHTHFVVSANMKDKDVFEMARRYQITNYEDVIFTCIDESLSHGLIYNFQKEFGTPLHSFGIGPHIPEDFEEASKERVLDLIFKLSNLQRETR